MLGDEGVLKTVRYYIYSNPAAVKIHIMDENKADLVTPFTSTSSGVGWFDVDGSSLGVSITSGVDFYLALEWISIPYPSLGVDSSSPDSRSYGVVNGVWTLYKIYVWPYGNILVDFMIRAVIETGQPPPGLYMVVRGKDSKIYYGSDVAGSIPTRNAVLVLSETD